MTVDEKGLEAAVEAAWNAISDGPNQWCCLSLDERETYVSLITAYETAKTAEGPVAWRWRPKGSVFWIYDPDMDWLAQQGDDIDKQPLYAAPPPPQVPHE